MENPGLDSRLSIINYQLSIINSQSPMGVCSYTQIISQSDDRLNNAYIFTISTNALDKRAVSSVAIGPDGQTLASGSYDKTIKLWDLSARQEICTLTGHSRTVNSIAFSLDGQTLVSGSSQPAGLTAKRRS